MNAAPTPLLPDEEASELDVPDREIPFTADASATRPFGTGVDVSRPKSSRDGLFFESVEMLVACVLALETELDDPNALL